MESEETNDLRPRDIFLFQIGSEKSILRVLANPWSLLIGVFLVWTAGIARHYDFHILWVEDRWIWAPFLVVLFSSMFSFIFIRMAMVWDDKELFWVQYIPFLAAFLMTAPIAWFYALPVEHWFKGDPLTCAKFNIGLLGLVSFWRVWLMIKVVRCGTQSTWLTAAGPILMAVSIEALVGSWFKALDIVGLMGGIELSPTQKFLEAAYRNINTGSLVLALVSFVLIGIARSQLNDAESFPIRKQSCPKGALMASAICLVVWIGYAIPFQINDSLREPRLELQRIALERRMAH